jgi:hypothetical protein
MIHPPHLTLFAIVAATTYGASLGVPPSRIWESARRVTEMRSPGRLNLQKYRTETNWPPHPMFRGGAGHKADLCSPTQ